jgi:hypothetical protein
MIAAALVTLKQHRFEIAFAALASIAVAVWALVTEFRLTALGVPARCIDDWLITGPAGREDCAGMVREWGSIHYSHSSSGCSAGCPSSPASWRHEQHKRLGRFSHPERCG